MVAKYVTSIKCSVVSLRPESTIPSSPMLTTNQKGAVAEAAVAKEAIQLGVGVYRPYGDERCDFIFDLRPRLVRVQCKWASCDGTVIYARLYSSRRARAGLIRRRYEEGEVD